MVEGHALAADGAGGLFSAAMTGHLAVGCSYVGSCIETMPCPCTLQAYHRFDPPFDFRVRALDGSGRAWSLLTPGLGNRDWPRYAIDPTGAHHLAWAASSSVTLAVFELHAP
jgi:hypothetical protein